MDPAWLTLLLFGSLVLLLLLGLPIAFTLGGLALIFTLWLWGPGGLLMLASHAYGESMNFILVSAPLFIQEAFWGKEINPRRQSNPGPGSPP